MKIIFNYLILLLICSVFVGCQRAGNEQLGTHYWIDGQKGDDLHEGSQKRPWKSIMKIESIKYKPGDVVHVMAGTYEFKGMIALRNIRGTPKNYVTIQATGAVELVAKDSKGCHSVMMFSDCHYLKIKGFSVTHIGKNDVMGFRFWQKPSSYVTIEDCVIHDLNNNGFGGSAHINNCEVSRCRFERLPLGIYWGYYESNTRKIYCHFNKISHNLFVDCPKSSKVETGYGIQIKGGSQGNLIEDNVFVNVAGTKRAAIGIYHISYLDKNKELVSRQYPNIVRGNFIMNCRGEGIYAAEGAVIENNILYKCRAGGIVLSPRKTKNWGSFFGRLTVRNNTVYQDDPNAEPGISINGEHEGSFVFANNLVIGADKQHHVLVIPENFKGNCENNYVYGKSFSNLLGIKKLLDAKVVKSFSYGDRDFLYPLKSLKTSPQLSKASSLKDFNGSIRLNNYVGAYGDLLGESNKGWKLGKTLKPIPLGTLLKK